MSDFDDISKANIHSGCLWHVLNLRVFFVEFREQLHIVGLLLNLFGCTPWIAQEGVRGEHFLQLVAHGLSLETSFKPQPHFFN
jgi:hypothetical protein